MSLDFPQCFRLGRRHDLLPLRGLATGNIRRRPNKGIIQYRNDGQLLAPHRDCQTFPLRAPSATIYVNRNIGLAVVDFPSARGGVTSPLTTSGPDVFQEILRLAFGESSRSFNAQAAFTLPTFSS